MTALREADLHRFTLDEFLSIERESEERIELFDGCIYSMAGASPEHEEIVSNISDALHDAVRNTPCRVYGSNLKIRGSTERFVLLPDLSVVCGGIARDPNHRDVVTNPRIIIEVLSPTTAYDDRGPKFSAYQQIETVVDYILVHQDDRRIEVYHRCENGEWASSVACGEVEEAFLPSIGYALRLDDVYDRVGDDG